MDQIVSTGNPELPEPQKNFQHFEGAEVTAAPVEKLDLPPQADRVSTASNAVSQAAFDDQSQGIIAAAQDDNTQLQTIQQPLGSLIADDVDVIEKAWVQKAKAIVDSTKDDPRQQSTQLSHVKQDYINKRFNKDIKLSND